MNKEKSLSPLLYPSTLKTYSGDKVVVEVVDKVQQLCSEQVEEMKLVRDFRRESGHHIG